jgi:hypothetical protein
MAVINKRHHASHPPSAVKANPSINPRPKPVERAAMPMAARQGSVLVPDDGPDEDIDAEDDIDVEDEEDRSPLTPKHFIG